MSGSKNGYSGTMTPEALMREVRRLEIITRHRVTEVFAGEYSSAFKGRGIEFAEVRLYQPGDDVRSIDWNVTARTGKPHVKRFIEERELTVMLVVDLSASEAFSSSDRLKRDVAIETSAAMAFAALRKNDKAGLMIFTDRIELIIPPAKGSRHALRLIRELLAFEPTGRGTDVHSATERLMHMLKRRSVVVLVSDFLSHPSNDPGELPDHDEALRSLAGRHDVIAVDVFDDRERVLPKCGVLTFEDAETGQMLRVDTTSPRVRSAYGKAAKSRDLHLAASMRKLGIDLIRIGTTDSPTHELAMFFRKRERRR